MLVIFVDAVNECEENSPDTVRALLHLKGRLKKAKMLISSTESVGGLRSHGMFPVDFNTRQIVMRTAEVTYDINRYSEVRFEEATRLKRLREPLQKLVKRELRA